MEKFVPKAIFISVLLSTMTLVLYALLGAQVRMVADDYCSAYRGLTYGPVDGVIVYYENWGSRFSTFFLQYLFAPLQPGVHGWMPLLTIILCLVGSGYFLSQLLDYIKLPEKQRFLIPFSIILTFTLYRLMPSYQHAFWFSAVIAYTWSITMLLIFAGTILHYFRKTRSTALFIGLLVWTACVVLVLSGFVETMAIFFGIVFLLLLVAALRKPVERRNEYLGFIIVGGLSALVGLFIVMQSPGSAVRQELVIEAHNVEKLSPLQALPHGVLYTVLYIFGEPFGIVFGQTFSLAFLGSLFLLILVWGLFYLEAHPEYVLPAPGPLKWSFFISIIAGVLLIFTVVYSLVYALGGAGISMRPVILLRFIQIVVVACWAYLALVAAQRRNWLRMLRRAKTWPITLGFISVMLIWSPAISLYKLADLYPEYRAYSQSWTERHEILLAAGSNDIVELPELSYDIEDSFALEKLDTQSDFWINRCVANYYGLDRVFVDTEKTQEQQQPTN